MDSWQTLEGMKSKQTNTADSKTFFDNAGFEQGEWDDVLVRANEEETATVMAHQGTTHLYHAETPATICPKSSSFGKKGTLKPRISTSCAQNNVCIALNNVVHIFGANCQDLKASVSFDSKIDNVCWTADGLFLVIAESGGIIHFYESENCMILFSQKMKMEASSSQEQQYKSLRVVPSMLSNGFYHIVLMTVGGILLEFDNVDLIRFASAMRQKDQPSLLEVKSQMLTRRHVLETSPQHSPMGFTIFSNAVQINYLTWTESSITKWIRSTNSSEMKKVDHIERFFRNKNVRLCTVTPDSCFLLVLDGRGDLSVWHLQTMVPIRTISGLLITDFVILASPDPAETFEKAETTLAIVSMLELQSVLKVVKLSTMEELYTSKPRDSILLIKDGEKDSFSALEMAKDSSGNQNSCSEIRVMQFTEALPNNRFYHLIHKHRFEEAMALARQYNLDTELVFRVQLTSMMDACQKGDASSETAASLFACLKNVQDIEFVVDCCLQACMPSMSLTLQLLEYALSRLHAFIASGDGSGREKPMPNKSGLDPSREAQLRMGLLSAIKRLGTLQMVSSSTFDSQEWQRFRIADLAREIISSLSQGRIATAVILWSRHAREYELHLHLATLLPSIPDQLPIETYQQWLKNDVFPLMTPSEHAVVFDWILRRGKALETRKRESWPQNAISLIDTVRAYFELYDRVSPSMHAPKLTSPAEFANIVIGSNAEDKNRSTATDTATCDIAEEITLLHKNLEDIDYLRTKLNLKLSYEAYIQETPMTIAGLILERVVAAEYVEDCVKKEVRPYLIRHSEKVQGEEYLVAYLAKLTRSEKRIMASLSGSAWEAKALAIIDCIEDTETQAEAILEVMKGVQVPCSDEIEQMIQRGLAVAIEKKRDIEQQHRILRLKAMLLQYGVRDFNLTDTSLVRSLLCHILSRCDIPSVIEDAMQLVSAYHHLQPQEVYKIRVQNLSLKGMTNEISALCETIPEDQFLLVAREIALWANDIFAEAIIVDSDRQERILVGKSYVAFGRAVVQRLDRTLYRSGPSFQEEVAYFRQQLKLSENLCSLMNDYNEFFSLRDLEFSPRAKDLLVKHGHQLVTDTHLLTVEPSKTVSIKEPVFGAPHREFGDSSFGKENSPQISYFSTTQRKNGSAPAATMLKSPSRKKGSDKENSSATNDTENSNSLPSSRMYAHRKFLKLVQLVGKSQFDLIEEFAQHFIHKESNKNDLKFIFDLCESTCEGVNSSSISKPYFTIANVFLRALSSAPNSSSFVEFINEARIFSQKAMVNCTPGHLCDCLSLFRSLEFTEAVLQQCETGVYGIAMTSGNMKTASGKHEPHHSLQSGFGGLQKTRFASEKLLEGSNSSKSQLEFARSILADRFKEDSLVLDSQVACPVASKFAQSTIPVAQLKLISGPYVQGRAIGRSDSLALDFNRPDDRFSVNMNNSLLRIKSISTTAGELIEYLKENNLHQLALRAAVDAFSVCAQIQMNNISDTAAQVFQVVSSKAGNLVEDVLCTLLTKALASPQIELKLAMSYMSNVSLKVGFDRFRTSVMTCKRNFVKLQNLACLGIGFSFLWEQPEFLEECRRLRMNAIWWDKLSREQISFEQKDFENLAASNKAEQGSSVTQNQGFLVLLREILNRQNFDLTMAIEFAKTYHISVEEVRAIQVLQLFCTVQTPRFTAHHQELIVESIRGLAASRNIFQFLVVECIPLISPYDYHRIEFALKLCQNISNARHQNNNNPGNGSQTGGLSHDAIQEHVLKSFSLLNILDRYVRVSPPTKYEIDFVEEQLSCQFSTYQDAAKLKLPFHHLLQGDARQILQPEYSVETIHLLLPVARLVGFNSDEVYTCTLEKTLACIHEHKEADPKTNVVIKKEKTEENRGKIARKVSVKELVSLINGIRDPETTIMAAKTVADRLPLGPDKITILELAVMKAKVWRDALSKSCSDSSSMDQGLRSQAEGAAKWYERFLAMFRKTATEHRLKKAGCDTAQFLALSSEPKKLIVALFESFLPKTLETSHIDCVALAKDVAVRYELDFDELAQSVIQQCILADDGESIEQRKGVHAVESQPALQTRPGAIMKLSLNDLWADEAKPVNKQDAMSSSSSSPSSSPVASQSSKQNANKNLLRALQLLKITPLDQAVQYLLQFAYVENSFKITTQARWRAFQVLFTLTSREKICAIAGRSLESLHEYFVALGYVARLEELQICMPPAEFISSNKEGLVRSLWRDHHKKLEGIRLIIDICIDFELFEVQLWSHLLPQLFKSGDRESLMHVLHIVSGIPEIWQVESLGSVWSELLVSALNSSEDVANTFEVLQIFMESPFFLQLDGEKVFGVCLRNNELVLATLICLLFGMDARFHEALSERLFDAKNKEALRVLHTVSKLSSPFVEKISVFVFDLADQHQMYTLFLGSEHFDPFVKYLIAMDRIDHLLQHSIQHERMTEAAKLLRHYCMVYPSSEFARKNPPKRLGNIELVRAYVGYKGLPCSLAEDRPENKTDE